MDYTKQVLNRSWMIAALVLLILIFYMIVRIVLRAETYLPYLTFAMIDTGIHMFSYIIFIIFIFMLKQVLKQNKRWNGLFNFGIFSYIILAGAELISLRLVDSNYSWDYTAINTLGEHISLTTELLGYTCLMVFYFLVATHLPHCSTRLAAFFVAFTQVISFLGIQEACTMFDVQWYHSINVIDTIDDFVYYGVMLWFLLSLPYTPIKSKYA